MTGRNVAATNKPFPIAPVDIQIPSQIVGIDASVDPPNDSKAKAFLLLAAQLAPMRFTLAFHTQHHKPVT
jgi:hypothetical protein